MLHTVNSHELFLPPSTVEDCFWLTVKAFNLADKYQTTVIILTDHHLASSYSTVDKFDLSKVTVDHGILYSKQEGEEYKRHKVTLSGISPRAFPGQEGTLVITDSDEHDEAGRLIEDAQTRTQQVQKRMRKLFSLKNEIAIPQHYGPKKAENTIIGRGSTYGAIREAVDILRKQRVSVNWLHLNEIWPFPSESVADVLDKANNSYVIKNNATGQLARLIRAQTGKKVTGSILKYDGRPFSPTHIVEMISAGRCDHGYTC
jgi:2-oxoglutarate ferredoxin oxidoreductase subunit alpha